jgi:hypothetical protein
MDDDKFSDIPIVEFVVSGLIVWCSILALASWMFGFL